MYKSWNEVVFNSNLNLICMTKEILNSRESSYSEGTWSLSKSMLENYPSKTLIQYLVDSNLHDYHWGMSRGMLRRTYHALQNIFKNRNTDDFAKTMSYLTGTSTNPLMIRVATCLGSTKCLLNRNASDFRRRARKSCRALLPAWNPAGLVCLRMVKGLSHWVSVTRLTQDRVGSGVPQGRRRPTRICTTCFRSKDTR